MQAVGADKAAATEKAMQDVAALKQELLAREQQLESTQSSMAELQNSTEKQVQALQVKIDSMDAAAKKEVGKLQSELENASKKVENLQKVRLQLTHARGASMGYECLCDTSRFTSGCPAIACCSFESASPCCCR